MYRTFKTNKLEYHPFNFNKMRNKENIWFCASITTGILLMLWTGCKKDNGTSIGSTTAIFNPDLTYGTMTDQDGNTIKTIQINNQVWMAENLKVSTYRNGDKIETTDPSTLGISQESNPEYQWACMNDESMVATFGRLYTWYAVTDSRSIAPEGWHVASYQEWIALRDFLGGENIAGGKLKEAGTTHWVDPNSAATNESGFTALPGGLREPAGVFYIDAKIGNWWTTTGNISSKAWHAYADGVTGNLLFLESYESVGYSVRCVKN